MAGLIFKITIEDTHPPVWRRIIFPELASFQDLHDVIQTAFGWDDDHLHIFSTQELEIVGEDVDAYKDFVMEDIASVGEIFTMLNPCVISMILEMNGNIKLFLKKQWKITMKILQRF